MTTKCHNFNTPPWHFGWNHQKFLLHFSVIFVFVTTSLKFLFSIWSRPSWLQLYIIVVSSFCHRSTTYKELLSCLISSDFVEGCCCCFSLLHLVTTSMNSFVFHLIQAPLVATLHQGCQLLFCFESTTHKGPFHLHLHFCCGFCALLS